MKLQSGWIALAALSLAAAPALAQGTFSPGQPKGTWSPTAPPKAPKPYVPPAAPEPAKPKTYGAPEAAKSPGFKPYEPYKSNPGTSIYGPDGKKKP